MPLKVSFFTWETVLGRVLMVDILQRRGDSSEKVFFVQIIRTEASGPSVVASPHYEGILEDGTSLSLVGL